MMIIGMECLLYGEHANKTDLLDDLDTIFRDLALRVCDSILIFFNFFNQFKISIVFK